MTYTDTWERIAKLQANHGAPAPVGNLCPVDYIIDGPSQTELAYLSELETERGLEISLTTTLAPILE